MNEIGSYVRIQAINQNLFPDRPSPKLRRSLKQLRKHGVGKASTFDLWGLIPRARDQQALNISQQGFLVNPGGFHVAVRTLCLTEMVVVIQCILTSRQIGRTQLSPQNGLQAAGREG